MPDTTAQVAARGGEGGPPENPPAEMAGKRKELRVPAAQAGPRQVVGKYRGMNLSIISAQSQYSRFLEVG